MSRIPVKHAVYLIWFLLSLPLPALPQGLLLDEDRPSRGRIWTTPSQRRVHLKERKIHAVVKETGVTVEVTETFHNDSNRIMEGTYLFPLPRRAAATGLSLFINGREEKGEILSRKMARRIYDGIVRRSKDPGLLEYVDQDLLRASIFPIQPRKDISVKVKYITSILRSKSSYHLHLPMKTSSALRATSFLNLDLSSRLPIRNIHSPTHDIDILRASDYRVRVTYKGPSDRCEDFSLYYTLSEGDLGFSLLTHRDGGEENYFLLMLSPLIEMDEAKIMAKDVVFLLDKSRSMEGEKWDQARDAFRFCLNNLNPEDRFGLIAFSNEAGSFRTRLSYAGNEDKMAAERYLAALETGGGTNILDALERALAMFGESERLGMIAFLTDGLPSVGATDLKQIIQSVKEADGKRIRIFNLGLGNNVNTCLLDSLASMSRGTTVYVEPGDELKLRVLDFCSKIQKPVLADIELVFEDMIVYQLFPKERGDLFAGAPLFVVGKYEGEGKGKVTLSGKLNGKVRRFTFEGDFTPESTGSDFLPAYWASRKIVHLLNQIRLGESDETLVEAVAALGRRYGLVTPYTSALVVEESERKRLGQPADLLSEGGDVPATDSSGFRTGQARSDKGAASGGSIKKQGSPAAAPRTGKGGGMAIKRKGRHRAVENPKSEKQEALIRAGGISFRMKDEYYVDTRYRNRMKKSLVVIEAGSGDYLELLVSYPELEKVFALGDRLIFLLNGKAYKVRPAG